MKRRNDPGGRIEITFVGIAEQSGLASSATITTETGNRATAFDLAMGLMFNVDGGFRRGVRSMVIGHVDRYKGDYFYMPAIYVGGARPS